MGNEKEDYSAKLESIASRTRFGVISTMHCCQIGCEHLPRPSLVQGLQSKGISRTFDRSKVGKPKAVGPISAMTGTPKISATWSKPVSAETTILDFETI